MVDFAISNPQPLTCGMSGQTIHSDVRGLIQSPMWYVRANPKIIFWFVMHVVFGNATMVVYVVVEAIPRLRCAVLSAYS